MPYCVKELKKSIRILCAALKTNESLRTSVWLFSILPELDFDRPDLEEHLQTIGHYPGIMPIIKIYPGSQRTSAQTALNICYELLKICKD